MPAALTPAQVAKGTALAEQGNASVAEKLFIEAKEPERAVEMYR